MKAMVYILTMTFFSIYLNAAPKEKVILKGKKDQISCSKRVPSHIFCDIDAFDIPGVCGQGFECILMKVGEKQIACDTEFHCIEANSVKPE